MTRDEALAAFVALPLPGRDDKDAWRAEIEDFLALPGRGQCFVLQGWRAAYAPADRDGWAVVVAALGVVLEAAAGVAGVDVAGLEKAVEFARGL